MSDAAAVSFERDHTDHETVNATVYLPLGITIELWSDEVAAERRWEVGQVDLWPGDRVKSGPIPLKPPRASKIGESELIAFVRSEWDREVARESAEAARAGGQEVFDVHA